MAQTKLGAERARQTNIEKHGSLEAYKQFMRDIAAQGGIKGKDGGFASQKVGPDGLTGKERARTAGAKGGRISRRVKTN